MVLHFSDIIFDSNNTAWIAENRHNALFCKKENSATEYIGCFPNEKACIGNLFHNVVEVGDRIVFTPNNATGIHIYEKASKTIRRIPLQTENTNLTSMACLYGTFVNNDCVYFLQANTTTILCLDTENYKITEIDIIKKNSLKNEFGYYWSHRICECEDGVFLCNEKSKEIIKLSFSNMGIVRSTIGDQIDKVSDFAVMSDKYIISDKNGKVVVRDGDDERLYASFDAQDIIIEKSGYGLRFYSAANKCFIEDTEGVNAGISEINKRIEGVAYSFVEGTKLFIQKDNGEYLIGNTLYPRIEVCSDEFKLNNEGYFCAEDMNRNLPFFLDILN